MDAIPMAVLLERLNGRSMEAGGVDPSSQGMAEGYGRYSFPSGLVYEGDFKEGMFDGVGKLVFPDGSRFEGVWSAGKLVKGQYIFEDDLEYEPRNWQYCTDADRRFWSEIQRGIRLGDTPDLTDKSPMVQLPVGCLEVKGGYYDPSDQCVYDLAGKFLRVPSKQEADWALRKARIGVDTAAPLQRDAMADARAAAVAAVQARAEQAVPSVEAGRVNKLKALGLGDVRVRTAAEMRAQHSQATSPRSSFSSHHRDSFSDAASVAAAMEAAQALLQQREAAAPSAASVPVPTYEQVRAQYTAESAAARVAHAATAQAARSAVAEMARAASVQQGGGAGASKPPAPAFASPFAAMAAGSTDMDGPLVSARSGAGARAGGGEEGEDALYLSGERAIGAYADDEGEGDVRFGESDAAMDAMDAALAEDDLAAAAAAAATAEEEEEEAAQLADAELERRLDAAAARVESNRRPSVTHVEDADGNLVPVEGDWEGAALDISGAVDSEGEIREGSGVQMDGEYVEEGETGEDGGQYGLPSGRSDGVTESELAAMQAEDEAAAAAGGQHLEGYAEGEEGEGEHGGAAAYVEDEGED